MTGFWKNAFAVDDGRLETFSAEERELCGRLARRIADHGLALPGLLFLESFRPMNFVGSQALAWLEPFVKSVSRGDDYTRFRLLLERRGSVELLLQSLEEAEARRGEEIRLARAQGRPGLVTRTWERWRKRHPRKAQ